MSGRRVITELPWIHDYADAMEVLRSPAFASTLHSVRSYPIAGETLVTLHGDAHTMRRRTEIVMFGRPALRSYEFDLVGPVLDRRLAAVTSAGGIHATVDVLDVMQDALVRVSAAIVGLDGVDDYDDALCLRSIAERLQNGASAEWSAEDQDALMAQALGARAEFVERFYRPSRQRRAELVAQCAAGRIDESELPVDLLTLLLTAYGEWDEDLVLRECAFFLIASAGTTTHAAPHVLYEIENWFADHPEDRVHCHDVGFLQGAVAEALRLHPPVPALIRAATTDVTLSSGRTLRAGEDFGIDLNSVNRDSAVFGPDAARFVPRRDPGSRAHHYGISFGAGPHVCPGRLLAVGAGTGSAGRDDVNVGVLTRLMQRLYDYDVRLDPDQPPQLRTDTAAHRYARFPATVSAPTAVAGADA